jgi:transposase
MSYRAHKIRLYPTPEQERSFVQSCGAARFAYNWGLARWTELYAKGEKVDKFSLRREFNALKKTEFAWAREVTSRAPMNSLLQLGDAFTRFSKKQAGRPVVADRFFPSSKRCHACGKINHALELERNWTCSCGTYHDRDFNAAMNLKLFPMLETAARLAVSACGDLDGRSTKQEFNPLIGG